MNSKEIFRALQAGDMSPEDAEKELTKKIKTIKTILRLEAPFIGVIHKTVFL